MRNLTQVFRTYNASITLDKLLYEQEPTRRDGASVDEKKADYDTANKEVRLHVGNLRGTLTISLPPTCRWRSCATISAPSARATGTP